MISRSVRKIDLRKVPIEWLGSPVERKKSKKRYIILGVAVIVVLIVVGLLIQCCLSLYVQNAVNPCYSSYDTWISSLASYWGGIIGGIISGSLAFFGVAITIKYYHDSDDKKAKLEYMPFLKVDYIGHATAPKKEPVFKIDSDEKDSKNVVPYKFKIKNIGRDFAYTLMVRETLRTESGPAFNKTILVNEETEIYLRLGKDKTYAEFELWFVDCMRNSYYQKYTFNDGKVECGYPVEVPEW